MKVFNNTSFTIIAYCWDERYGSGRDVIIESDEIKEVPGPRDLSERDDKYKRVMKMEVYCHEEPENESGFHVSLGNQLCIGYGLTGITVRHHSEDRQIIDVITGCGNSFQVDAKGCEQFGFTSGEKVFVVKTKVFAIVRGTSIKPPGMKACCEEVDVEVLWIQVEGDKHVSVIFHPDISLEKT